MALEVYDNQFLRDLTSGYTAGSGTLSVSSAAPASVQGGQFRVRLANSANTLLIVTGGASTTTWTVTAEANDANCAAAPNAVLACEITAGCMTKLLTQAYPAWLNITDPTATSFSWRNQGSATVTQRGRSLHLLAPGNSGDSIRGREIAASAAPFSVTIGFISSSQDNLGHAGMYVSDGTKLVVCGLVLNEQWAVQQFNSVTSFSSTVNSVTIAPLVLPFWCKIFDDGTNLKFYTSANGYDFYQQYSQARTSWLSAVSFFGFLANSSTSSSNPAATTLISWATGTS